MPDSLARRLTTIDAVVIGLGAMLGAGVFAAFGPAAQAAGSGILLALALAAIVAYCNATSSAALAARWPESGGTYVYGRRALGPFWGHLAGWGFVVGKTASCAAMALTIGAYAAPDRARPIAVLAVVVLTVVNLRGVTKTAALTRVIVTLVLAALAVTVVGLLGGGTLDATNLTPVTGTSPLGILQAAGLLFFAFAGYARIATLGEEVIDPAQAIPRAIPLALGIVLAVYALVGTSALLAVGAEGLAGSPAPLAAAVEAGGLAGLAPVVRAGAAVAATGVLLSLIAGVSRTALAMARRGELPQPLARVNSTTRVPHVAEVTVAVAVIALVSAADLRGAIGFSSFAVLTYYAIANASASTLPAEHRRWPRWLAGLGVVGCVVIAFTLPLESVIAGVLVLGVGAGVDMVRTRVQGRVEDVSGDGG